MFSGMFSFWNSEIWCRQACTNISVWLGQVVIVSKTWKWTREWVVETQTKLESSAILSQHRTRHVAEVWHMWENWPSERWIWGRNSMIHWMFSSFSGSPLLAALFGYSKQTYNIPIYPEHFRKAKGKNKSGKIKPHWLPIRANEGICCLSLGTGTSVWRGV